MDDDSDINQVTEVSDEKGEDDNHEQQAGPTKDQLQRYRTSFNLFDKRKTGKIHTRDIGTVMRSAGLNPSNQEIDKLINETSQRGRSVISFKECSRHMFEYESTNKFPQSELEEAFKVFDKEGNGYIEQGALKMILSTLGEALSDKEVDELLKQANVTPEGHIDYKKFTQMVCSE